MESIRSELGDFSSIVCLKAIITGMEDALGEKATAIALIAAGRARGRQLAEQLGLKQQQLGLDQISDQLSEVLGKNGTRLLLLDKIEKVADSYRVYTRETVCSAGESPDSPRKCTFTLGAIQGVLETITGERLRGQQIGSVLRGEQQDIFEYTPIKILLR